MSKICPFCSSNNKTAANFCFNCGGVLENLFHPLNTLIEKRYKIIQHLKKGGMANVYLAVDTKFSDRLCALKEMIETYDNEEMQVKFTEWFKREMQLLCNLRHAGIPDVWDHFAYSGRYYIVMEYIEGKNLEDLLNEKSPGGFPEQQIIRWALELSDVLDYLHTQNPPVIHRDIKPTNIILRKEGRLMLIDFGIARNFSPATTGTRIGTIGYIAPEHYKGKPEPRSDLYSLGITLYQLLTGINPSDEIPFNLPPVTEKKPGLSIFIVGLISQLIALNPDDRFRSAEDLMQYLKSYSPSSQPASPRRVTDVHQLETPAVSSHKSGKTPIIQVSTPEALTNKAASSEKTIPMQAPVKQAPEELADLIRAPLTFVEGSPRYYFDNAPICPLNVKEIRYGRDGAPMLLVIEGSFLMGASIDEEAYFHEKPVHSTHLKSYYMDKYPVTVRQFLLFIEETNYHFKRFSAFDLKNVDHPVGNVSWHDALAYARWCGKRLPLEAEWERAARGVDGRKYTWGNNWDRSKLNSALSGIKNTTPVGLYPSGVSPVGCHDMLGNVWEWTLDAYAGYPYSRPSGQKPGQIAMRGGSCRSEKKDCRCTARDKTIPSSYYRDLGFRCAISAE